MTKSKTQKLNNCRTKLQSVLQENKVLQNAASAALPLGPIRRSMCATSLPSPTRDSPTSTLLILAIIPPNLNKFLKNMTQ